VLLITHAKATEEEWFRQASKVERKVYEQTDEGTKMLKMLRLEEAAAAFGRSIQTETKRLLVVSCIAKFYLGDFGRAADILLEHNNL
jgi:hypothetical protein